MFHNLIQCFNFQISSEKSEALTVAKPHDLNNSPPTIRINGVTIAGVTLIKVLGIKIDKQLPCIPRFNYLKDKLDRKKNYSYKLI